MLQLLGYHTTQHPWKSFFQGAGKEALTNRTSGPGGAMWIPFRPWNSGPALYPRSAAGGIMGVCPSSVHLFCRLEEGLQLCLQVFQ